MIKNCKNRNYLIVTLFLLLTLLSQSTKSYATFSHAKNQKVYSTTPDARFGHSMVYDSHNKKIILFGGSSDDQYVTSKDDTWAYDYVNNNWTELNPANSPSRRLNFAMAYDSDNQRIILFGGNSITTGWELDDTWIYDYQTNTWSLANPSIRPPGRSDHAMVYDPVTKQTILFGGMRDIGDATFLLNDTWAYDYESNTWTELEPSVAPLDRYGNRLVYNSIEEKVVLFGGNSEGSPDDDIIWTLDPTTTAWNSLDTTDGPGARYWYGLSFDSHQNKLVVFSGSNLETVGSIHDDTWVYDFSNKQWTEVTANDHPPARSLQSMVYDQENRKIILFGGFNFDSGDIYDDVWVFDTNTNEWTDLEPGEIPQINNSTITSKTDISDDNSTTSGFESFFIIIGLSIAGNLIKKRKK